MEKVIEFLKQNKVTTVATSQGDKPRVSILEYIMIGDSLCFSTSADSVKALNLKQNKRISASVQALPKYVTIDGSVVELTPAELTEFQKIMFELHPEFKELLEKGLVPPFAYFKLVPETAYYSDMTKGMAPAEVIKA